MTRPPPVAFNIIATFLIGAFAGAAPFLLLRLLPAMLSPGAPAHAVAYGPLFAVAFIVGVVTVILFAKQFAQKEPQDIFFYALGVPAILVATASNIATDYGAKEQVAQARQDATRATLDAGVKPLEEVLKIAPEPVRPVSSRPVDADATPGLQRAGLGLLAQTPADPATEVIVIIGEYTNEIDAQAAFKLLGARRLGTEVYVAKRLELLKVSPNRFLISYGRYATSEDANRVARVLGINDPDLPARTVRIPRAGATNGPGAAPSA